MSGTKSVGMDKVEINQVKECKTRAFKGKVLQKINKGIPQDHNYLFKSGRLEREREREAVD